VLTPLTAYRVHPVEETLGVVTSVLISGSFSGLVAYLFIEEPTYLTILGAQAIPTTFYAAGHHLRHSHIWLSWGPWISRILISPAQHQIHHSIDPKHWNKNYGYIFAIWDWMFGSLYVPKEREDLKFGLDSKMEQIHPTAWAAYVVPFQDAWCLLSNRTGRLVRATSRMMRNFGRSTPASP